MENVKYLGCSTFTSKKNGQVYYMIHLARLFDARFGIGYKAEAFYATEQDFNTIKDCKPFTDIKADIRFINGRDALITVTR